MTQLAIPGAPPAPPALSDPVVFADVPVYHFENGDPSHPVCDGTMHCPVAVNDHPIGHAVDCVAVRPGAGLPQGWRWATLADVMHVG